MAKLRQKRGIKGMKDGQIMYSTFPVLFCCARLDLHDRQGRGTFTVYP